MSNKSDMKTILADASASITDLKRDPAAAIEACAAGTVAILKLNKPCAYLVSVATYERMLDQLEDLELTALIRARAHERRIRVRPGNL